MMSCDFRPLMFDDEADAAGVMLVAWIVQALSHNLLHRPIFPWRDKSPPGQGYAFPHRG